MKTNRRIIKRFRVEARAALCYKRSFTVTMSKPSAIPAVRGFRDILPEECSHWQTLESASRDLFALYGFGEVLLPILERTDLFARAVGETTMSQPMRWLSLLQR